MSYHRKYTTRIGLRCTRNGVSIVPGLPFCAANARGRLDTFRDAEHTLQVVWGILKFMPALFRVCQFDLAVVSEQFDMFRFAGNNPLEIASDIYSNLCEHYSGRCCACPLSRGKV